MLIVETIVRIRREQFTTRKTIEQIARGLKVSQNTIPKMVPDYNIEQGILSAAHTKNPIRRGAEDGRNSAGPGETLGQ